MDDLHRCLLFRQYLDVLASTSESRYESHSGLPFKDFPGFLRYTFKDYNAMSSQRRDEKVQLHLEFT